MEANVSINNLQDLLDLNTSQFLSGETALKSKLIEWANIASSMQLKLIMKKYINFTSQHLQKMDTFLQLEESISVQLVNPIMLAYISLIDQKMDLCKNPEIKDACILSGLESICHYKISCYGTAVAHANLIGKVDLVKIFQESEINERHIDDELKQLAFYEINTNALILLNLV